MRILVTGASGWVGRHVVRGLAAAGADVHAMSRRPDLEVPDGVGVVRGDLADPDSLTGALTGAERMYLFPVPETAREVVARAVDAGVRRVVVLSSGAVTTGYDTDFHLPVERAVQESGLEWTFVRPGEFAVNKLHMWGASIRTASLVYDPFPDTIGTPVHEQDVADVAVLSLLEDGHAGHAYTIVGPEPLTRREMADRIAAAIGREVRFAAATPQECLDHYLGLGGWAAANAPFLLGLESYSADPPAPHQEQPDGPERSEPPQRSEPPVLPTARSVTGRPARTFARWAEDHAGDFR